ncbi:MAG TPA: hypothetical protein VHC20_03220 [Candidatus Paceibacterota bacterium]|nr:hypothetical protein [Candidatus Paceibacterota bacterium]
MEPELSTHDISELRFLVQQGEPLPVRLGSCSLAGAVHLACSGWLWQQSRSPAFATFRGWLEDPRLALAWEALTSNRSAGVDYAAHAAEILTVTDEDSQARFANRFRKSLEEIGGFSASEARGLAGALQELADNVTQHSGPAVMAPASGVMAYEVSHERFTFAVGDIGRGALASLHDNPHWTALQSEEEALRAILEQNASRRRVGPGMGFRNAVRALADLGQLSVGSGDAYSDVVADARGRTGAAGRRAPLPGVQVALARP